MPLHNGQSYYDGCKTYINYLEFNNLSLNAKNRGNVKAIAVIKEKSIYAQTYFIFNLLPSKNIKILAAVAVTNKSVVADCTAGVEPQSSKKSLPC